MPKITKRVVDAAVAGIDRYYLWDSEVKGFGLLVLPSGVKSYFYRYRTREGRERRYTIGKHGTWTPDEARKRAEVLRQAVRNGSDPLGDKRTLRQAPTVSDLLDAYVESERFKGKAESTKSVDHGRIRRHLKPTLGRKHVHALTPGDIERAAAAIRDGKTAVDERTRRRGRSIVKGGDGVARECLVLLRAVINWAIGEGMVTSNPCALVKIGSSGTRDTIIEDPQQYARLFRALMAMEQSKCIRRPVADAIRVIALTGARRGEIANLRWAHVDLKRGLLTLPPKSHKAGRRTGKSRIIGLPAAAQAIISRQEAGKDDDYVFAPARVESGPLSLSKPWRAVRAEAKLPAGIGLHGLRHSLASHMAMAGAGAGEIMTALGHAQMATAQRYVHWAQDARQALSERAASAVLAGMLGKGNPDEEDFS